jgi:hypothetical protein
MRNVSIVRAGLVSAVLWCGLLQTPVWSQGVVGGVYIDGDGMLRQTAQLPNDERLKLLRQNALVPGAADNVQAVSPLRKVSLRRLEAQIAALHAAQKPLPAEIQYLAGLQRIQFVLFHPEADDVVLAGPAEGWKQLPTGEVVGTKSGRPVLHLDDWLVALRFACGENPGAGFLGCSIEPTPEGVQRYAQAMGALSGINDANADRLCEQLAETMGPQAVKLFGSPDSSRFSLVMASADYRLKRLAMGHDPSPVAKVASYMDLASKRFQSGPQPQHRWWFVGEYDAIHTTAEALAFEFQGTGVQVRTGPSTVMQSAPQKNGAKPAKTATQFAETATKHFGELSERIPVFAELQNIVALSLTAALIARSHEEKETQDEVGHPPPSWKPTHLLDEEACPIAEYAVPRQTPSLATYRHVEGKGWIVGVSGGIEIVPRVMFAQIRDTAPGAKPPARGKPGRKEAAPAVSALERAQKSAFPANPDTWWWD